jgi:hypothetical protein
MIAVTDDPTARTRIQRLNTASMRTAIDPDRTITGSFGDGQIVADELLTIADLPELVTLSPAQRRELSRQEVASTIELGIRFEAVLMAGLSLEVANHADLTDPAAVYALHEIGEETRHSRLFIRALDQLDPCPNPMRRLVWLQQAAVRRILRLPSLFYVLVLTGEEIPDLVQKRSGEHPDTDPFLRDINRYHRMEEARHLAYARTVLVSRWRLASRRERWAVRHVAPLLVGAMFFGLVHPGVYATVGLPTWATWRRANRSPSRVALRHEATRPIAKALVDAGVLVPGRIPKGWQRVCGLDRHGQPGAPRTLADT